MPRIWPINALMFVMLSSAGAAEGTTPPPATPPGTTPLVTPPPANAQPVAKPAPPAAPALKPLPSTEAIEAAQRGVRESFKDEYSRTRNKPEDRLALARKLLEEAPTMIGSDAERVGMLREAAELAARAGDTAVALTATDQQALHFIVNLPEERLRVLVITVIKPASIESALAAGEALCGVVDDGIADDNYPLAQRAAKEADTFSRRLKDPAFAVRTKLLLERAKLLGDEFDKLGEITDLLGNTPPDSHLRYGRFLCFSKGDWLRGLPHLAEGDDPALKAIAEAELAAVGDDVAVDAPLKVAEGWYDVSQKQRAAIRDDIQAHALTWYRRASTAAQGVAKVKLDKRIEEIEGKLAATGRRVRYPAGAILLLTFERETLVAQGQRLTQVQDTSGHNLRATVTGQLSVESGGYGTALKCDGKSWLSIGNGKEVQITGGHTIAFWMRPDALGARRNPFEKSYINENSMVLEIDGSLNYLYGNNDSYQVLGLPAAGVPKRWTHVALVRDFTAKRLTWFKDGKKETEVAAKYAMSGVSTADQKVGTGYCNPFLGLLDDVGLWPRALAEAEIKQLHEATSAGR